jgi:NitT/TauT family transport system permease protein
VIANTLAGLNRWIPRSSISSASTARAARGSSSSLPWALPQIWTGLRVAAGLAVIGAIVRQFVGGGGLGVVVLGAMRVQRTDLVFATVLHAAGLGLALFDAVSFASRLSLRRWHSQEEES